MTKNTNGCLNLYRKAGDLEFIGVHYSEECGGQGLGVLEMCLIWEEFFRVDSTLAHILWGAGRCRHSCKLRY
jgi:alkylation response protein AidB-like acyl-CoA dehydrogenase